MSNEASIKSEPAEAVKRLRDRARAIRLQNKQIAELSGRDETTIGRVFAGESSPLLGTLEDIEAAVSSEERRMRRHLTEVERNAGGRQTDIFGDAA